MRNTVVVDSLVSYVLQILDLPSIIVVIAMILRKDLMITITKNEVIHLKASLETEFDNLKEER